MIELLFLSIQNIPVFLVEKEQQQLTKNSFLVGVHD